MVRCRAAEPEIPGGKQIFIPCQWKTVAPVLSFNQANAGIMLMNPETSPPRKFRSLKVFFRFWVALFFIALIAANSITLLNLYKALHLTDQVVEHSIVEMHYAMLLQMSLTQAAMPPNDYLIHGKAKVRGNFRACIAGVERNFATLSAMTAMTPAQHQALTTARHDWERAKKMGEAILNITSPIGNPAAAGMMEEFDQMIGSIVTRLDAIHHVARAETGESHEILHGLESDVTLIVAAFLAAGFGIAIAGFLVLNRLLFPPLRELSKGMRRFSEGQLGHRIAGDMPVELRELANGFNTMAEKLQAQHAELVKTSSHDVLTGCFNHRQFIVDFAREFSRAQRYQETLSLLMTDLDHFKVINDTYGHPVGDKVLQKVAEAMGAQLRASDLLYRYGGEEFVILLPETDIRGALVAAESIRQKVADISVRLDGDQTIAVTISIGVACFPQDTDNQDELLKKADVAVYAAKNGGRNRVCHLKECA